MDQKSWFSEGLSQVKLVDFLIPVIFGIAALVFVSVMEIYFQRDQGHHWMILFVLLSIYILWWTQVLLYRLEDVVTISIFIFMYVALIGVWSWILRNFFQLL